MKDMLDREIKPGQTILYAATDGRSAALRLAKVLEIKRGAGYYTKDKDFARVQPLTGRWYDRKTPLKETTLQYGERIYITEEA